MKSSSPKLSDILLAENIKLRKKIAELQKNETSVDASTPQWKQKWINRKSRRAKLNDDQLTPITESPLMSPTHSSNSSPLTHSSLNYLSMRRDSTITKAPIRTRSSIKEMYFKQIREYAENSIPSPETEREISPKAGTSHGAPFYEKKTLSYIPTPPTSAPSSTHTSPVKVMNYYDEFHSFQSTAKRKRITKEIYN